MILNQSMIIWIMCCKSQEHKVKVKGTLTNNNLKYKTQIMKGSIIMNTELQWKRSIQQILSVGKFQKIRLNKKIKAQYNVVCNGYPFIIVNR